MKRAACFCAREVQATRSQGGRALPLHVLTLPISNNSQRSSCATRSRVPAQRTGAKDAQGGEMCLPSSIFRWVR
jgi:hypothetical protein